MIEIEIKEKKLRPCSMEEAVRAASKRLTKAYGIVRLDAWTSVMDLCSMDGFVIEDNSADESDSAPEPETEGSGRRGDR